MIITDNTIRFYHQLDRNNNKEWFQLNKDKYQTEVYDPFKRLVELVMNYLKSKNQRIEISPEKAIFRLNRDMRFSKGQSPYKCFSSALISLGCCKCKEAPSLYMELTATHFTLKAGVFKLSKNSVKSIEENYWAFNRLLSKSSLVWESNIEQNGKLVTSIQFDINNLISNQEFLNVTVNFWEDVEDVMSVLALLISK